MERWDEVLFNQGEVLVTDWTTRHHGLPPLAGQHMPEAVFMQRTPHKKHVNVVPNTTHLDPCTDPVLKNFLGTLGLQEDPTYGQLLFVGGGGLEAHLGLAVEDIRMMFSTPKPRVKQPPPMCRHHPTFIASGRQASNPWGPWRGGCAVEGRADGRGCPGAVGNRWVPAAGMACKRLAAAKLRADVPQRQACEERWMEHLLSLRVGGMVHVACCRTGNSRDCHMIVPSMRGA